MRVETPCHVLKFMTSTWQACHKAASIIMPNKGMGLSQSQGGMQTFGRGRHSIIGNFKNLGGRALAGCYHLCSAMSETHKIGHKYYASTKSISINYRGEPRVLRGLGIDMGGHDCPFGTTLVFSRLIMIAGTFCCSCFAAMAPRSRLA